MDEDEHPSNSMIVGKAKSKGIKRQRDSQEARQTSSSRPRLKRKRSADELEINTQLDSESFLPTRDLICAGEDAYKKQLRQGQVLTPRWSSCCLKLAKKDN